MLHGDFPRPPLGESVLQFPPEYIPGKTPVQVVPLLPWTWTKKSVLDQLIKPIKSVIPDTQPTGFPQEPEYHVKSVPYNTGFKPGELIRLNFPPTAPRISGFI